MMKAEMASDRMRSRSHTPRPGRRRTPTSVVASASGAAVVVGIPGIGASDMRILLIVYRSDSLGCFRAYTLHLGPVCPGLLRLSLSFEKQVKMRRLRRQYASNPLARAKVCAPCPYPRLAVIGYLHDDFSLGRSPGRGRHRNSRLQRRSATKRNQTSGHAYERSTLGSRCAVSVPDSRLRSGGEDTDRPSPAALLLLLRPDWP